MDFFQVKHFPLYLILSPFIFMAHSHCVPLSQQNIMKREKHHKWGFFSEFHICTFNLDFVVFDVNLFSYVSLSHFRECQETQIQFFQITTKNKERKSHLADDSKYFVNI